MEASMTRLAMAVAAVVLLGASAQAQSNGTSPHRDPKACAPGADSNLKIPDTPTPAGPKTETTGSSLSETLAQSNGVLCPPNIDPEIRAPTPDVGRMPVIPPPGSPGGDPSVQPK
jgi:hypothetical protein